jgi:hypothetical protein
MIDVILHGIVPLAEALSKTTVEKLSAYLITSQAATRLRPEEVDASAALPGQSYYQQTFWAAIVCVCV